MGKIKSAQIWVRNLSARNKILFFAGTISLVLLVISLAFTNLKNKQTEKKLALDNIVETIEQKQNQVDANLLYSNEAGAKIILEEINNLLDKLASDETKKPEDYEGYLQKNKEQLEKIQHVVKIDDTKELANFSNINSQARALNIMLASNKIYSGDTSQKTIYTVDLASDLITAITDLSLSALAFNNPVIDNDKNIYYINANSVIELKSETGELSSLNISLPDKPKKIAATAGYNNRVYALDSQNNQIYRLIKTPDGFTRRDDWLTQKADFSQAVSLSIDGHIYVLLSKGQVLKYLKGQAQEFELEEVSPKFSNPTKIIVSPDLEFIYILEPNNKRLVIFDKTGDFLIQYKNDNFNDLKDFTVDEINKKIYFLNGNSVYEVEGKHFGE